MVNSCHNFSNIKYVLYYVNVAMIENDGQTTESVPINMKKRKVLITAATVTAAAGSNVGISFN